MKDHQPLASLEIDVSAALPSVGDRKRVEGSAEVIVAEGYDMRFEHGTAVSWSLELRRIAGALEISGQIEGNVKLECYRCLEEFVFPLKMQLREHALWLNGAGEEESDEPPSDYLVSDGMLDLEPVLRDTIALAFPVRRVCSDECKGLCAQCGANLNVEPCGCRPKPADVRLEPLAELKRRLELEGR